MRSAALAMILASAAALRVTAAPPATTEDPRENAIRLYDQGRYAEALAAFHALDADG